MKPSRCGIVCSGLDSVRRGYETHARELFEALQAENPGSVILFKRDGARKPNEVVTGTPSRGNLLVTWLAKVRGTRSYWEKVLMAIWLLIRLVVRREGYVSFYCLDPVIARIMTIMKRWLPGQPMIIFVHGVWMQPDLYAHIGDLIQEVSIENYQQIATHAQGQRKAALIPYFIPAPTNEISEEEQQALRARLGLRDKKVILSVGKMDRSHKRMDYLMSEVAKLSADWALVICGRADDELLAEGKDLLGDRLVHQFLPRTELMKMYQMADVFVLASEFEGFGIVNIEAMSYGLPVILHDRELFHWITGSEEMCVDMTQPDNLSKFIQDTDQIEGKWQAVGARNQDRFYKHFSWEAVKSEYREMLFSPTKFLSSLAQKANKHV